MLPIAIGLSVISLISSAAVLYKVNRVKEDTVDQVIQVLEEAIFNIKKVAGRGPAQEEKEE